jgi:hypothetical protein
MRKSYDFAEATRNPYLKQRVAGGLSAQRKKSPARQYQRESETRLARIEALLDYAEKQIEDIRHSYEEQLPGKYVPLELAIKVKNCCENLRSSLDFWAHYVFERTYPGEPIPPKLNFPLAWVRSKAGDEIQKRFPGLRSINPGLWALIDRFQPYKRGNKWLRHFGLVVNDNKHWDLVAQRTRRANVGSKRADGLGPVVFLLETENVWVEYRFKRIEANAFFLLLQVHANIWSLVLEAPFPNRKVRCQAT